MHTCVVIAGVTTLEKAPVPLLGEPAASIGRGLSDRGGGIQPDPGPDPDPDPDPDPGLEPEAEAEAECDLGRNAQPAPGTVLIAAMRWPSCCFSGSAPWP